MNTQEFTDALLIMRDIEPEDCCPECGGVGTTTYSSTSTWSRGVGGQAITSGVCDKCWGSGSKSRPWQSWRERERIARELQELKALAIQQDKRIDELMTAEGLAQSRIAALEAALKPFADLEPHEGEPDSEGYCMRMAGRFSVQAQFTAGDLRTARALLEGKAEKEPRN